MALFLLIFGRNLDLLGDVEDVGHRFRYSRYFGHTVAVLDIFLSRWILGGVL